MPATSRAQYRYFKWAESHPKESGVSKKVSKEFTSFAHGHPGSVKALPEHKAGGGTVMGRTNQYASGGKVKLRGWA